MSAKVGLVSVYYYPDYLDRAAAAAAELAVRAGATRHVAVANRPELVPRLQAVMRDRKETSTKIVAHDNIGLEFGAYQAGLDALGREGLDWIVFANDTHAIHQPAHRLHRRNLLRWLARPVDASALEAAGQIVDWPRSFAIEGKRTHRWLTTSVFAVNARALAALDHSLYRPEIDALIAESADVSVFFSPALDPALVEHLTHWLLRPSSASWYGAEPLGSANCARLARKARSILQEKYVAARLESLGTWFLDTGPSSLRDRIERRWWVALSKASVTRP